MAWRPSSSSSLGLGLDKAGHVIAEGDEVTAGPEPVLPVDAVEVEPARLPPAPAGVISGATDAADQYDAGEPVAHPVRTKVTDDECPGVFAGEIDVPGVLEKASRFAFPGVAVLAGDRRLQLEGVRHETPGRCRFDEGRRGCCSARAGRRARMMWIPTAI